jgi:hypothetical protein
MARLSSLKKAPPVSADPRADARHAVVITRATLRRHGEQPVAASLCDLSIYGCRLAAPDPHEPGERVWLRLASSMPVAATVVWSANGVTGCRFDVPIDRALMRTLTLAPALSLVAR